MRRWFIGLFTALVDWVDFPESTLATAREALARAREMGIEPEEALRLLVEMKPFMAKRLLVGEESTREEQRQALEIYRTAQEWGIERGLIDEAAGFRAIREFRSAA